MKRHNAIKKRLYAVMFLSALISLAGMTVDGFIKVATAALTEADCRVCHDETWTQRRVEVTNTVRMHHLLGEANGWSCTSCHDPKPVRTEPPTLLDCTECHSDLGHGPDHDNATAPSASCEQCHSANVVTEHVDNRSLACAVCHDNADLTVQGVIAQGKAGSTVYCSDCHVGHDHVAQHDSVGPPSQTCSQCHDANVVVEHVDNRGFTCAACHGNPGYATIIDDGKNGIAVTCDNCHVGHDHHATAEAQTGDCTYCHIDPRPEIDASAPTGQLACRQCHGTNQHDNGGPIQDYGACFACHQPTPYHAKPTTRPSNCFSTAPGKGTFNLFYNQFTWGYKSHKNESCKNRRYDYQNPAISFTMVDIFDYFNTNSSWNVPTFGAGGGGAPTDTVTIIYAKFNDNNNRLEVFAESDMGQGATLSVTYKGSNYSMSWDSSDEHWYKVITSSTCSGESIEVTSSEGGSATNSSILHCP